MQRQMQIQVKIQMQIQVQKKIRPNVSCSEAEQTFHRSIAFMYNLWNTACVVGLKPPVCSYCPHSSYVDTYALHTTKIL